MTKQCRPFPCSSLGILHLSQVSPESLFTSYFLWFFLLFLTFLACKICKTMTSYDLPHRIVVKVCKLLHIQDLLGKWTTWTEDNISDSRHQHVSRAPALLAQRLSLQMFHLAAWKTNGTDQTKLTTTKNLTHICCYGNIWKGVSTQGSCKHLSQAGCWERHFDHLESSKNLWFPALWDHLSLSAPVD